MRSVRKPEVQNREEYVRRFSPLRSARDWDLLNLGMEMIRRSSVRCDFVRYEDLVADLAAAKCSTRTKPPTFQAMAMFCCPVTIWSQAIPFGSLRGSCLCAPSRMEGAHGGGASSTLKLR
jgi:hypothetical protein